MNFIPNTDADRKEMLKTVGVDSLADLYHDVPEKFRFPELNLPRPSPNWRSCKSCRRWRMRTTTSST